MRDRYNEWDEEEHRSGEWAARSDIAKGLPPDPERHGISWGTVAGNAYRDEYTRNGCLETGSR